VIVKRIGSDIFTRIAIGLVLGVLSGLAVPSPAQAYGPCAPYRECVEWYADCYSDCGDPCGYREGCYHGRAEVPPRHQWRPRHDPASDRHATRREMPTPPLPARKPRIETAETPPNEDAPGAPTARQQAAAAGDIPSEFRDLQNDVGHTLVAIEAGAEHYANNCAACHGAAGEGNGPRAQEAGSNMISLPAIFAAGTTSDAYLIWSILGHGAPFSPDDQTFDRTLTEDQAWELVAYLKAGFPARGGAQPARQMTEARASDTAR